MKSKLKLAALFGALAITPAAVFAEDTGVIDVNEQLGVVQTATTTAGTIAGGVLALSLALFAVAYVVRMIRRAGRAG